MTLSSEHRDPAKQMVSAELSGDAGTASRRGRTEAHTP